MIMVIVRSDCLQASEELDELVSNTVSSAATQENATLYFPTDLHPIKTKQSSFMSSSCLIILKNVLKMLKSRAGMS